MSIKMFSNIELAESANLINDNVANTFPENPKLGTQTMIQGVLYYYTSMDGEEPVWVPTGIKRLSAVVNIDQPQLEWIVEHSLSTFDIIAAVYDVDNKLMDAPFTILSANIIKFTFTNPVKGKAVIFGSSQKYAGFTPAVNQLTGETVTVGTGEPDATTTSTLYIQVDSVTA